MIVAADTFDGKENPLNSFWSILNKLSSNGGRSLFMVFFMLITVHRNCNGFV